MASGRDALTEETKNRSVQAFHRKMSGLGRRAFPLEMDDGKIITDLDPALDFPLEMDDGKIITDLDPALDPPPSPAMDSLNHGRCHPLAGGSSLRTGPSLPVFEIEGEMGPTRPIVKGFQV
jgi:hypothetical protein